MAILEPEHIVRGRAKDLAEMKAEIREASRIDFFPSNACVAESSCVGRRPERAGERQQAPHAFWRARRLRERAVADCLEFASDHDVNDVAQHGDRGNRLVGGNLLADFLKVHFIRHGLPQPARVCTRVRRSRLLSRS